ncbi:cob(I)yrinic acid a,c-diamide adenosyltransferase [Anaerospora hongkongensis]|nr:cob(I)yrinic acid a,c-diamide adenosyltransferase [Anaerospora hongkongensis]
MAEKQGLILVNTGNGKGKTTAALGLAMRAWGQGLKVLVVQFIKGNWKYGELEAARRMGPDFVIRQMGEGFVQHCTENERPNHELAAAEALHTAKEEIAAQKWDMIILDEINYAVKFGLVAVDDVLSLLEEKPAALHVVLTGRDAHPQIVDKADLVTEMKEIKHHHKKGIKAQKGIEF